MSQVLVDTKTLNYLLASLEAKQRLYVDARAAGMLPIGAAVAAGYQSAADAAEKLEQNLTIRTAIEYTLRLKAREEGITKEDVIQGMLDGIRLATDGRTAIQGWREIGLLKGYYAPQKVEIDKSVRVTHEKISQMSDEEVARLAAIDAEFVVLEEGADEQGNIHDGDDPEGGGGPGRVVPELRDRGDGAADGEDSAA